MGSSYLQLENSIHSNTSLLESRRNSFRVFGSKFETSSSWIASRLLLVGTR